MMRREEVQKFLPINIEERHPQFLRSIWEFVGEGEYIHPITYLNKIKYALFV
jgi:hypothetical protein